MTSPISPSIRSAIFSVSPKHRSEGARTSVGFIIHSGQEYTLGLTAYHGVKPRQQYQAVFDNRKTDLHFVAANIYSDFALVVMPTPQIGELRPALPLTKMDPGKDRSVTCLGFPEINPDDKYGGHLTRSTLPNSGISQTLVSLLRYLPGHDIEVQPALPGGFSGSPVIYGRNVNEWNVIGIISATNVFDKTLHASPYSHGPSAAKILCELHNWGNGITGYFDKTRTTIAQAIKDGLLQVTR